MLPASVSFFQVSMLDYANEGTIPFLVKNKMEIAIAILFYHIFIHHCVVVVVVVSPFHALCWPG